MSVNKTTDFMSEIYKTFNNLNRDFIKEIFALRETSSVNVSHLGQLL